MRSKHTSGPWSVEYDGSLVIGGQIIGKDLAPDSAPADEQAANIRLIAASPELLLVAQAAYAYLCFPEHLKSDQLKNELQKVLEKARGA